MVESRAHEVIGVYAGFSVCCFIVVSLRVYVRGWMVKAFGWDDYWMLLALLINITLAFCACTGAHYGTGQHMVNLTPEHASKALKYWWLCYIFFTTGMVAAKISIGLFLLRITPKTLHKWIIYIATGMSTIVGLTFSILALVQCHPISFFWNRNQPGLCLSIDVIELITYLYSAIAVLTDTTFAVLPIFLVYGLNMSGKTKIVLIPILGMGCVASIAVIIRIPYIKDFKNPDFLYATTDIAIWSAIEQGLAIIAGSLATLRPLFQILATRAGLSVTGAPLRSKPGRFSRWTGGVTSEKPQKSMGISKPFGRGMNSQDPGDAYGMGDLQPMRVKDEMLEDQQSEKSEKCVNWRITSVKVEDVEARPGTITMQSEIHQHIGRR